MIELAKTSINIAAPIDSIFKYVTNMENYKHWFPGVIDIRSENNLSHGVVGKKYVEILSLPEGDAELKITVSLSEANKLFLTKGDLAGILPQMKVTFSVNEDRSCQVNLQYHSRNPDLTPVSDIVIALREDLSIRADKGVSKLKAIMEQSC